ncbi:MAG: tRNA lysidine(34) synthetase TilS [Solirubrobacterales bacterium]
MVDLPQAIAESGVLSPEGRALVLLSGGGDSVALLDAITALQGASRVAALHVNYGLRGADSEADERHCLELVRALGLRLYLEGVSLPSGGTGNLQEMAREARYRVAEKIAESDGFDDIVVAHTADDQAETVLYRLLASPGRRSLAGMAARRGRIARPLLGVRREELREWCRERGLTWREDASNSDPRFARARVRELLTEAQEVHPAAVENILATAEALSEEGAALDSVAAGLLARAVDQAGALVTARLAAMPPALASLVLRAYVEERAGTAVPAAAHAVAEAVRLGAQGGSHTLQIESAELVIEYGAVRVAGRPQEAPAPVTLGVPGAADFGPWRIAAGEQATEGDATARLSLPESSLTIRPRAAGDRIRPVGLDGSKSLQDLFVDRKVPRAQRDAYPVVCAGDEIVWVPGLAASAARAREDGILLSAHLHSSDRGDDR